MAPWARVTQSVAMGRDVANAARTERSRACRTSTPYSERRERGPKISLFPSADCGLERVISNDERSLDDSSPTSHRTTFLDPFFARHAREETRAASNRDVSLTSAGHCRRTYMYERRRVFSADYYLHSHARRSSTRIRHHNLLRISRK